MTNLAADFKAFLSFQITSFQIKSFFLDLILTLKSQMNKETVFSIDFSSILNKEYLQK